MVRWKVTRQERRDDVKCSGLQRLATIWRHTADGYAYHCLGKHPNGICKVHGSRWWLVDQFSNTIEFPTMQDAMGYGQVLAELGWAKRYNLVDARTGRIVVEEIQPHPAAVQLDLFAQGGTAY